MSPPKRRGDQKPQYGGLGYEAHQRAMKNWLEGHRRLNEREKKKREERIRQPIRSGRVLNPEENRKFQERLRGVKVKPAVMPKGA